MKIISMAYSYLLDISMIYQSIIIIINNNNNNSIISIISMAYSYPS